jgi:phage-related protein
LNSLEARMRAKVVGMLEILQDRGNLLREPYSKYLGDGIFEIRCKQGSNISRVLYFFWYDGKIILTNGFIKKSQKAPKNEIALAKSRRKDYMERMADK